MTDDLKYRISLEDFFSKGIQNAEKNAGMFEKGISHLGSELDNLKRQAIGAFGVFQAWSFMKGVIDTGSMFESANIQLKTLLGSAEKANVVFKDLQTESTKSPFSFQTLLQGNAALIASGVNAQQAKGDFNALANAIAASGKGNDELSRMVINLQQIKNVGQASALDVKQFAFAGINIYALLNTYYQKNHIALKEQKQDYDSIIGSLKLAGEKGGQYFGGLSNLADSTSGRLSNLSDSFDILKNNLFLAMSPAINRITKDLTSLFNFIASHLDTIKELGFVIGFATAGFVAYKAVLMAIEGVAVVKFVASMISMQAASVGATFTTTALTMAQTELNMAMTANPIGLVITALGLLAIAIYEVMDNYDKLSAAYDTSIDKAVKQAVDDEKKTVNDLALAYGKLNKVKKEVAQENALRIENENLTVEIANAKKAIKDAESSKYGKFGSDLREAEAVAAAANRALTIAMAKKSALTRSDIFTGADGKQGVGGASGLDEPKASKIQNITINMGGVFANQKNTFSNAVGEGVNDFMGRLSQALNAVVLDSALIAAE